MKGGRDSAHSPPTALSHWWGHGSSCLQTWPPPRACVSAGASAWASVHFVCTCVVCVCLCDVCRSVPVCEDGVLCLCVYDVCLSVPVSEYGVVYVYVCVCMCTRIGQRMISGVLGNASFETGPLMGMELTDWARPDNQWVLGILLSLNPQHCGTTAMLSAAFPVSPGDQIQVLVLWGKRFPDWTILPVHQYDSFDISPTKPGKGITITLRHDISFFFSDQYYTNILLLIFFSNKFLLYVITWQVRFCIFSYRKVPLFTFYLVIRIFQHSSTGSNTKQ